MTDHDPEVLRLGMEAVREKVADYVETHVRWGDLSKREAMIEAMRVLMEEGRHDLLNALAAEGYRLTRGSEHYPDDPLTWGDAADWIRSGEWRNQDPRNADGSAIVPVSPTDPEPREDDR